MTCEICGTDFSGHGPLGNHKCSDCGVVMCAQCRTIHDCKRDDKELQKAIKNLNL